MGSEETMTPHGSEQILPVFPGVFVKVCVKFLSDREGVVVTAFLAADIRASESQRWP